MKKKFLFFLVMIGLQLLISCDVTEKKVSTNLTTVTTYTVTFDVDGGSVIESQKIEKNGLVTEPTPPTKNGYTFGGWYKESSLTTVWNFTTDRVTSDITLYAKWEIVHYTITYNLNGGSGVTNPTSYTVETDTFNLSNPTKLGHVFVGWSGTELTGSNNTVVTITKGSTGNRIYTANWFNNILSSVSYRQFVSVTGGTYNQRSPYVTPNNFDHTISFFMVGRYEVTYELWYTVREWAINNGYNIPSVGREGSVDSNNGGAPTTNKYEPVTMVSWRSVVVWCNAYSEMSGLVPVYYADSGFTTVLKDASNAQVDNAFENWQGANGYRLPSEGEWQFAACNGIGTLWNYASGASQAYTGSDVTDYPIINPVAWYGNSTTSPNGNTTKTQPVGGKSANGAGIHDMSGNVWEWCWDRFGDYPSLSKTNYRGPSSGTYRIHRGGSWSDVASSLLVGVRSGNLTFTEGNTVGFRIARTF